MKILGWFSLVMIVLATLIAIGDSKNTGIMRVCSVVANLAILVYIVWTLFG